MDPAGASSSPSTGPFVQRARQFITSHTRRRPLNFRRRQFRTDRLLSFSALIHKVYYQRRFFNELCAVMFGIARPNETELRCVRSVFPSSAERAAQLKEHKEHKFMKPGKVVVLLAGRYAGKKAIIVKTFDEGTREREFGHCLVAGIERYPLEVNKSMSKKKILKRSKVKPFLKYINYQHIMPTRYVVSDIDLRTIVTPAAMKKMDVKEDAKKEVKKAFDTRYLERGKNTSGVQYFFHKLRF